LSDNDQNHYAAVDLTGVTEFPAHPTGHAYSNTRVDKDRSKNYVNTEILNNFQG